MAGIKLRPCPFCGEVPAGEFPDFYQLSDGVWVVSHYCGALAHPGVTVAMDVYGDTKQEAAKRWNTRAAVPETKTED